jgi:cell division septation protein DedD
LSAPGKPHAESAAPAAATDESGDQAAGPPRGWFVQVGVFLEAARADAVAKRLESEGVHVHSEAIHGPRGNFTRVRAGPFAARAAADEVLARVKGLGENAILVHQ